jgi:hypothetical protein
MASFHINIKDFKSFNDLLSHIREDVRDRIPVRFELDWTDNTLNVIHLHPIQSIPEPSTSVLMAVGAILIVALLTLRKRLKRKHLL